MNAAQPKGGPVEWLGGDSRMEFLVAHEWFLRSNISGAVRSAVFQPLVRGIRPKKILVMSP